jgi:hypothetical protein
MWILRLRVFFLLPSIVLSFIQLIYIHIDLLLKADGLAGEAPTNRAHMSNSRRVVRISAEGGHQFKRRTLCEGRGTLYVF